jgi:hypothetical protein
MYFDNFSVSGTVHLMYNLAQAVLGLVHTVYNLARIVLRLVHTVYNPPRIVLRLVHTVYNLPQVVLGLVHTVYKSACAGSGTVSVRQDSAGTRNNPHAFTATVSTPAKRKGYVIN